MTWTFTCCFHVCAVALAAAILADWGGPLILQEVLDGVEFDVLGLGDGEGGIVGSCAIRKTVVSEKGKALGGVVVRNPDLDLATRVLVRALRWRGPFEMEFIREPNGGEFCLIEINPRFPAWVGFPTMLGANFPAALIDMLLAGTTKRPLDSPEPGQFYLRHQSEVIGDLKRPADGLSEEPVSSMHSPNIEPVAQS